MAKKRQQRWDNTPEHDAILLKQVNTYPTNTKHAFSEAARIIREQYGAKRTAGACENRYYTKLSNPQYKHNVISNLPVVLTKTGVVHRARRLTPAPDGNGNLTPVQVKFLKKIVDRLDVDQKAALAEMLIFEQ